MKCIPTSGLRILKPKATRCSIFSALFSLNLLAACGSNQAGQLPNQSNIDSVNIEQTPIENQRAIGLCWAYATVALVESNYKVKHNSASINLSEEALGFYRMAETFAAVSNAADNIDEIVEYLKLDSFEGGLVKSTQKEGVVPDALQLIQKYGLVPESQWNIKFTNSQATKTFVTKIKSRFLNYIQSKSGGIKSTPEQIIQHVMVSQDTFKIAPPTQFNYNGTLISATSFAREKLEFKSEQFEALSADNEEQLNTLIAAVKRALARGLSVPIGFPVNFNRLHRGAFSGKGANVSNPSDFLREGGHAVLITDFVNNNGTKGAISATELAAEIQKPSSELDFFVLKNSWGLAAQNNESGSTVSGSVDGYYTMDRSFLIGSANVQKILSVVVPSDIALNPYRQVEINSVVTRN